MTYTNKCDKIFGGDKKMKRIYAFTLDSEDYPSEKFGHNLRLIAYLLYDAIYNYDDENTIALVINKNIKSNNIHDGYRDGEYYLDSDCCKSQSVYYEPFLLGKSSFALTVDDELMNEEVICELMKQVLFEVYLLSGVNYNYKIRTISYFSKKKDDESNRKKAICQLHNEIERTFVNEKVLVRKRVTNKLLVHKMMGLF